MIQSLDQKKQNVRRASISKEKVTEFFKELEDIIDNGQNEYDVEDDTIRTVRVRYSNGCSKVLSPYIGIDDYHTIENLYRDFIEENLEA